MTKKETTTAPKPRPAIGQDRQPEPALAGDLIDTGTAHEDEAPSPSSELVTQAPGTPTSMIGGITTEQLRIALATQTEQRQLIKEFIQDHLVEDTDYGRIHVVKQDKCPNPYTCKQEYHYSKRVLFKPGQEKLFSLFQITDKLERDEETYKMLPTETRLVAYKCTLYRNGQEVTTGRGCASVGDKGRDANATIKIAEKRARMDACLSLGFSEYFAQDLDDPDYKNQADMANQRIAARAAAIDTDDLGLLIRDAKLPIDDAERALLGRWIKKRGYTELDDMLAVLQANGIDDPKAMTSGEARETIRMFATGTFAAVPIKKLDTDVDDDLDPEAALDAAISNMPPSTAPAQSAPAPIQEEELVVDDDLKTHVTEQFESLGLNARGQMWFKKYVTGRPFGDLVAFTDEHWRKAYRLVYDILDERIAVEDAYVAGLVPTTQQPIDFSQPKSKQNGAA